MARKTTFEELIEITAHFPWWIGIFLALISYFWLHDIALTEPVQISKPGEIGQLFYLQLAKIGQYLLPAIFSLGALISALKHYKRVYLHKQAKSASGSDTVNNMSWQEFEMLIGEVFRNRGFSVHETTLGADGGVDLELRKDKELRLVQCKHWRASKVGVSTVRELYGVMAACSATGGYVVTSGRYTQDAVEFSKGKDLILIDGARLKTLLGLPVSASIGNSKQPSLITMPVTGVPFCPKCSSVMVKRVAKKGVHTGKDFWGCPKFPSCRVIVPTK